MTKFINRKDEDKKSTEDGRVIYFSKAPPQSGTKSDGNPSQGKSGRTEFSRLVKNQEEEIFSFLPKKKKNTVETINDLINEEKKEMKNIQTLIKKQSESLTRAKKLLKEMQITLETELNKKSSMFYDDKFTIVGQLSSKMAHDIRNPLNVIKLQVDLLKLRYSKREDGIMLDSLGRMEKAVCGITVQLNDVLNFLKTAPLQIENASLQKILSESLAYVQNPNDVLIALPTNDVILQCDGDKMQRVFVNMIQNSLDAVGKEGTVTIGVFEKDDETRITITDTGSGIPDESLEKIFDPLFTTKPNGTGLGLSICKKIVEDHDGGISVENNPTTFTVSLPKNN